MKVTVFYKTDVPKHYRKTALYKSGVLAALGKFAKLKGDVNLIFVNGKEIHQINKSFLNHDYETDVISFNYPYEFDGAGMPFGDVFVSFDEAKKNAALYKQSILKELQTYSVHGALHLAGMDDATPQLRKKMDLKTDKIINSL